jgi:ABC-2 type transport system ATP-binding protein
LIRIDGVSFGYRNNALYKDFSLQLDEPGVYGVFGRNGSGKSTLLKLLAGLLFPRRGRIEVEGLEPRRRHPDFLSGIYFVPEEFHLPDLDAARLARVHAPFYPHFDHGEFASYLQTFEVPRDARFEQMSLGQKKKAAIAFALAANTPVLLLDEPTNGLDIIGRDQFRAIMGRPAQRERTTLISTHQAHDLEKIMSHIVFIDSARLAMRAAMPDVSRALRMGVAEDAAQAAALPGLIYQEAYGEHIAYVADNPTREPSPIQLELLYKALSRNRDGVLAALERARGVAA